MHGLETIIAMNRKGAPTPALGLSCSISMSPGMQRPPLSWNGNGVIQAGKLQTEDIVKAPKNKK